MKIDSPKQHNLNTKIWFLGFVVWDCLFSREFFFKRCKHHKSQTKNTIFQKWTFLKCLEVLSSRWLFIFLSSDRITSKHLDVYATGMYIKQYIYIYDLPSTQSGILPTNTPSSVQIWSLSPSIAIVPACTQKYLSTHYTAGYELTNPARMWSNTKYYNVKSSSSTPWSMWLILIYNDPMFSIYRGFIFNTHFPCQYLLWHVTVWARRKAHRCRVCKEKLVLT